MNHKAIWTGIDETELSVEKPKMDRNEQNGERKNGNIWKYICDAVEIRKHTN